MRLADFIERNMERIVARWESFARTQLPAAARMKRLALRDHAQQILQAIAHDLRTPQSRREQTEKSMGLAPEPVSEPETAAQTHALLRAHSGFDIRQLAAEYRALRASVLRLWIDDCASEAPDLDDLMRFNEAIDQALTESIDFFTARVDQSRNLFLGMLGHDMRSPLQSILITGSYLSALNTDAKVALAAQRLISSGKRMNALLDDLVDFNRTQLGLGIPVTPAPDDLARLCEEAIDELRTAYPSSPIELEVAGDAQGNWDGRRLQQVLCNLVVNAIKYGKSGFPVRVTLAAETDEVCLAVRNIGEPIDAQKMDNLFDPLTRGEQDTDCDGSLGLGLFIAREIANAHGGNIEGCSDSTGTTFSVHLPRL